MNKKVFFSIIIVVVLIIISGVFYFISITRQADDVDFTDGEKPSFGFNPFGLFGGEDDDTSDTDTDTGTRPTFIPKLRQLSFSPVAGASFVEHEDLDSSSIRFIEKETGHIFETHTDNINETRLSNTTIPKVQEALWGNNGDTVVIRYIDEDTKKIKTFLAQLLKEDMSDTNEEGSDIEEEGSDIEYELTGVFLSDDIRDVVISSDGENLLSIIEDKEGSVAITSSIPEISTSIAFISPFKELSVGWPNINAFSLFTSPSSEVNGFLYIFEHNSLNKVLGKIQGLTASVSPNLDDILYSEIFRSKLVLNIYDNSTRKTTKSPITTLPEKCIWSNINTSLVYCAVPREINDNRLPDNWYQGETSFIDDLWTLDTQKVQETFLFNVLDFNNIEMDIIDLQLNETEEFLMFTNKKDSLLWLLQVK